jgi:hypothetical protein
MLGIYEVGEGVSERPNRDRAIFKLKERRIDSNQLND